jgi:cysteine desulfurase
MSLVHAVTSVIEHQSVLEPIRELEKRGVAVTYLPVTKEGLVDPKVLKSALRPETSLVSIMYANNEIGTIQTIHELAKVVRRYRQNVPEGLAFVDPKARPSGPIFHTDAAQVPGQIPVDMPQLGVDLASFTAQKFYGPKGVGFLYKKRGVELTSQMLGGSQERHLRAGTENVAGIVGMAVAFEEAIENQEKESKRLTKLRDELFARLKKEIPNIIFNGSVTERLPGNVNFSIPGLEGELVVLELDARGFAVSTGSACTTDEGGPSHVILALTASADWRRLNADERGKINERAVGAVRMTMGRSTKKEDIEKFVKAVAGIVEKYDFNK